MFNVGGGELLVILLVALVVLGPTKLPEAARQAGQVMKELRRISSGFQAELKSAMDDPVEAVARDRGREVVASEEAPAPSAGHDEAATGPDDDAVAEVADPESSETPESEPEPTAPPMSPAEAAGMYDLAPASQAEQPEAGDAAENS